MIKNIPKWVFYRYEELLPKVGKYTLYNMCRKDVSVRLEAFVWGIVLSGIMNDG